MDSQAVEDSRLGLSKGCNYVYLLLQISHKLVQTPLRKMCAPSSSKHAVCMLSTTALIDCEKWVVARTSAVCAAMTE